MPNENFRRELGQTFDDMTGSPSAALRDRVRSSLAVMPERRGPFWIAGLAAALIGAIVVGLLVVSNLNRNQHSLVPGSTASPSPAASPFVCGTFTTLTPPTTSQVPVVLIDAMRTGTHAGYDRLTVEFKSGFPKDVQVRPQAGTMFVLGASGQTVTLAGKSGILVVMNGADLHSGYSGSSDIKTGYANLAEVRQVEDFEGVVQLGLGVAGLGCYRAYFLDSPARLVIDIPTPS